MKPWACLENLTPAPLNTPGGIIQGQFFKLIIKTYLCRYSKVASINTSPLEASSIRFYRLFMKENSEVYLL